MTATRTYRLASWNVNGLRAVLKKDPSFTDIAAELDADVLALQETKLQEGQVDIDLPGYHQTWSYAERKGYSGTAVFSREEPLSVRHADAVLAAGRGAGLDDDRLELVAAAATEGRVCALEFEHYWFVDVYTPNAQRARPPGRAHGMGRRLPRLPALPRGRDRQTRRDLRGFQRRP